MHGVRLPLQLFKQGLPCSRLSQQLAQSLLIRECIEEFLMLEGGGK